MRFTKKHSFNSSSENEQKFFGWCSKNWYVHFLWGKFFKRKKFSRNPAKILLVDTNMVEVYVSKRTKMNKRRHFEKITYFFFGTQKKLLTLRLKTELHVSRGTFEAEKHSRKLHTLFFSDSEANVFVACLERFQKTVWAKNNFWKLSQINKLYRWILKSINSQNYLICVLRKFSIKCLNAKTLYLCSYLWLWATSSALFFQNWTVRCSEEQFGKHLYWGKLLTDVMFSENFGKHLSFRFSGKT